MQRMERDKYFFGEKIKLFKAIAIENCKKIRNPTGFNISSRR